jgi:lipopolysaccharide export system protein LptA
MRTVQTARYARWSAIVAVVLAATVGGVYAGRSRHSRRTQPSAAPVPASVQEQSADFSLSKVTGQQTQYTVRASNATEFKEGGLSLLQNVLITAFGKAAERFDNLQSGSCNYVTASGLFTCAGPVQMDLQSSQDAREHSSGSAAKAGAHVVHISTSEVAFDGQSGVATTSKPVAFRLPQGEGNAVGARFDSHEGGLQLLSDVHITLNPAPPAQPSGTAPANPLGSQRVEISSTGLVYDRANHVIHLAGPVTANEGARTLHAGKVDAELDDQLHIRRLTASDHPVVDSQGDSGVIVLHAETIVATVSSDGWIQQIVADTNVQSDRTRPMGVDHMTAKQAQLDYAPGTDQLTRMTATGDVKVQSNLATGASRRLATSYIVMDFVPAATGKNVRLAHATTPQATLDSLGSVQSGGKTTPERITLTSHQLQADFGEQSDLQKVLGSGGVEVQRQIGDMPAATSTSRDMTALFIPGDWDTVEQTGDVRLRNGDKTALTPRALFDHFRQNVALDGPVTLTDASSHTTANSANFLQAASELMAEGNVITSEIPDPASPPKDNSHGPAHISSEHLAADTMTGHAIYTGHARMWQGDSVVESDEIELDRATQVMTATGRVRTVFPKQQNTSPASKQASAPASKQPGKPPEFVHTESGRLIYQGADHKARLEQGAMARTDQGTIRSASMDLYFTPASTPAGGSASAKPVSPLNTIGSQTFDHAIAMGDVVVEQGDRHGKAARADYTAEDGKFVLSGNAPTVYDSLGNATNGRQLTFIFDDDSIVVDSDAGSRTVTLHRVEK